MKDWTRERAPLEWPGPQELHRLRALGARRPRGLDRSVRCGGRGLSSRPSRNGRVSARRDWARTQASLGILLTGLAQREGSTDRFRKRRCFREALKERTRSGRRWTGPGPRESLATALSGLAQQEDSSARYEEAIAAPRETLGGWTRSARRWTGRAPRPASAQRLGLSPGTKALPRGTKGQSLLIARP